MYFNKKGPSKLPNYRKHVFVCQNLRDVASGKNFCGDEGKAIRDKLKQEITKRGLKKEVRINSAGCLGQCKHGPAMVIYPEGTWYGHLRLEDTEELLQKSILDDKIIERLLINPDKDEKSTTT